MMLRIGGVDGGSDEQDPRKSDPLEYVCAHQWSKVLIVPCDHNAPFGDRPCEDLRIARCGHADLCNMHDLDAVGSKPLQSPPAHMLIEHKAEWH